MGFKWVIHRIQDLFKRLDYRRWNKNGCIVIGYQSNSGDTVYLVQGEEYVVRDLSEISLTLRLQGSPENPHYQRSKGYLKTRTTLNPLKQD